MLKDCTSIHKKQEIITFQHLLAQFRFEMDGGDLGTNHSQISHWVMQTKPHGFFQADVRPKNSGCFNGRIFWLKDVTQSDVEFVFLGSPISICLSGNSMKDMVYSLDMLDLFQE